MAKRFGRQQKRRLRAQLAALHTEEHNLREALFRQYALADRQGKKNRRLQAIVEQTAELLGRHFITLEPGEIPTSREGVEQRSHVAVTKLRALAADLNVASFQFRTEALEEALHQLEILRGTAWFDRFDGLQHYRLTVAGQPYGYALDRRTLRTLGQKEAARLVARELASHFLREESRHG